MFAKSEIELSVSMMDVDLTFGTPTFMAQTLIMSEVTDDGEVTKSLYLSLEIGSSTNPTAVFDQFPFKDEACILLGAVDGDFADVVCDAEPDEQSA